MKILKMKYGFRTSLIFTLGTAANQKHILNARDIPIFSQIEAGDSLSWSWPASNILFARYKKVQPRT